MAPVVAAVAARAEAEGLERRDDGVHGAIVAAHEAGELGRRERGPEDRLRAARSAGAGHEDRLDAPDLARPAAVALVARPADGRDVAHAELSRRSPGGLASEPRERVAVRE